MKIPKALKLPRKLKKEVKKGFNRNIKSGPPVMSFNPGALSCSMHQTVSYSGSNTKSFRRLCKFARKEEKRVYEKMIQDAINRQFDLLDDNLSNIKTITTDNLKVFQQKMFCEPIQKTIIGNVPEYWKDTTIQLRFTETVLPIKY